MLHYKNSDFMGCFCSDYQLRYFVFFIFSKITGPSHCITKNLKIN